MTELIIKDSELEFVERYIGQYMQDLIDLCHKYHQTSFELCDEGFTDSSSEFVKLIMNEKVIPIGYMTIESLQKEMHSKERTSKDQFMNGDIQKFVAEIDELDSILY